MTICFCHQLQSKSSMSPPHQATLAAIVGSHVALPGPLLFSHPRGPSACPVRRWDLIRRPPLIAAAQYRNDWPRLSHLPPCLPASLLPCLPACLPACLSACQSCELYPAWRHCTASPAIVYGVREDWPIWSDRLHLAVPSTIYRWQRVSGVVVRSSGFRFLVFRAATAAVLAWAFGHFA